MKNTKLSLKRRKNASLLMMTMRTTVTSHSLICIHLLDGGYNDFGQLEVDADDYHYSDDENEETAVKAKPTPKKKGALNQVPKPKQVEQEEGSQKITKLLLGMFLDGSSHPLQLTIHVHQRRTKASQNVSNHLHHHHSSLHWDSMTC